MILIAISAHYIPEYMSEHPCYACPEICDVDHIHKTCKIKNIKEYKNGYYSNDNRELGVCSDTTTFSGQDSCTQSINLGRSLVDISQEYNL